MCTVSSTHGNRTTKYMWCLNKYKLNRIFNLPNLFVFHKFSFEISSSSNLINTFDDLFRHKYMSPIHHMKNIIKMADKNTIFLNLLYSITLIYHSLFCIMKLNSLNMSQVLCNCDAKINQFYLDLGVITKVCANSTVRNPDKNKTLQGRSSCIFDKLGCVSLSLSIPLIFFGCSQIYLDFLTYLAFDISISMPPQHTLPPRIPPMTGQIQILNCRFISF